jgi:hypothetical protein
LRTRTFTRRSGWAEPLWSPAASPWPRLVTRRPRPSVSRARPARPRPFCCAR